MSLCPIFFHFWLLPLGVATANHLLSSPLSSIYCILIWHTSLLYVPLHYIIVHICSLPLFLLTSSSIFSIFCMLNMELLFTIPPLYMSKPLLSCPYNFVNNSSHSCWVVWRQKLAPWMSFNTKYIKFLCLNEQMQ